MKSKDIYGMALKDYFNGDDSAHYVIERNDGFCYDPNFIKSGLIDRFDNIDKLAIENVMEEYWILVLV